MHHHAVPVVIHGIEYTTMQQAAVALALTLDQVRRRVNSTISKWAEWRRKDTEEKPTTPCRSTRKVKIHGVTYDSITEAARAVGLTYNQLYGRLISTSVEFSQYEFVTQHPTRISHRTKNVVVVVDGVEHPSLSAASRSAGVTPHGLRNRMRNGRNNGQAYYRTVAGERIA